MNSFSKRLALFLLGLCGFGAVGVGLSAAVIYKPWGVPDHKRDYYDQTVSRFAKQTELREKYKVASRPKCTVTNDRFDLGWVAPGDTLRHAFEIENSGELDLTLAVRSSSKANVTAEVEDSVLPPGGRTRCLVTFQPINAGLKPEQSGANLVESSVTVVTNDPLNSAVTFRVFSKLKQAVVVPQIVDFGAHDLTVRPKLEFLVYSQLWEDFEIKDVRASSVALDWFVETVQPSEADLAGKEASSAYRLILLAAPEDYGVYAGDLTVEIASGDPTVSSNELHTIECRGKVRPPIGFYGPEVDMQYGVDLGTLENGIEHCYCVSVRSRGDKTRKLAVLDVAPDPLRAELEPMKIAGLHRLKIIVPPDCPTVQFNLDQKRGYVQVGDPNQRTYSAWLPIRGVVTDTN